MPEDWTNQIHQGDAANVLGELPESSVHCVMTSPPYYGLRDYGVDGQIGLEESLDEYVASIVEVAEELRRVLRSDGSWWLNLGDSFAGSWGGQGYDGPTKNQAEAHPEKNPARNASLRRKTKMLVPHRVAIALQDAGWIARSDAVWSKPNPMPHPVKDRLHEHKEFLFHLTPEPDYWFDLDAIREPHKAESLERRGRYDFNTSGTDADAYPTRETDEYIGTEPEDALHPNGKNPGDVFEIAVKAFPEAHFAVYPPELCEAPIKSSCPPEVCAECGTPYERESEVVDREVGGGSPAIPDDETGYSDESGNHQGTYHEEGFTQPTDREIGPWEQACDCETDETEPGVVLDPFAGAGTTLLVAKDLGRRFVGIDLNEEYIALAQKRVGLDVDQPELLLEDDAQTTLVQPDGGEERCSLSTVIDQSRGGGDA